VHQPSTPILVWPYPLAFPLLFSLLGGFYRAEINGDIPGLLDLKKNIVSFFRIKKNL
jgi:hypothetical protein